MSQTPCPERQQLSAYLLGRIDEATSEILDAHFLQCQQCQTLLAQTHPEEDTFVLELKSDHSQSEFEDEPALRNVIQRISKHDFCKENDTPPQNKPVKLPERETVLEPSQAMILGPYRLLKVLGKGGMGQVYLAEHMRLEMIVAIKVLADWLTHDRRAIARFDREMKAVGRFNHPNIVRATDAGEFQGQHYLAMEYVDGQDLLRVIQTSGRLKINDACAVISQAAAGIQHAHENNLIHRDLKPSNLMITKDGVVKVLDLGLARLQANADDGLTSDFQIMGTADYMAPEQALTVLEVDSRVDIYSLGCTLYALLCGRPPFADKNHSTTLRKIIAHQQEQPQKANEHRAEIPVALSEVIDKAIAKSPADRYASANDLAIALEPFVDGADLAALYKSLSPTSEETDKNTGDIAQHLAMTDILTSVKPKPMAGDLPPNRASRNGWLAAAIMLLTATGLASLILRFNTASGTIIVEIDGDQIQTSLDGERVIIEDKAKGTIYHLSVGDEQTQKQLSPGKYTIRVENKTSGLMLDTHEFEITRDDATVVKAYLQQKALASSTIPPQPTNPDSTSPMIESTTDSFEEWALAKGAILEIESNGSFHYVKNMESLPKEEFRVLSLEFTKPIDFSKEDFERMGKVTSLRHLDFQDLELTDRVINQLVALPQILLLRLRYDASIPRQLQMLNRLPRLQHLTVKGDCVSDDDVRMLVGLTDLHALTISGKKITDAALQHIGEMEHLSFLSLNDTKVAGSGLFHLQKLTKLWGLHLAFTAIDDAGTEAIARLPNLKWLNLGVTNISDRCLDNIIGLEKLDFLELYEGAITGESLPKLQKIGSLRKLDLRKTLITDADVDGIASITQLTTLLIGDRLSPDAVARLQEKLPDCEIVSDSSR